MIHVLSKHRPNQNQEKSHDTFFKKVKKQLKNSHGKDI